LIGYLLSITDNRRAHFNVVRDRGIIGDGRIASEPFKEDDDILGQEGGEGVGIRGEEGVLRKLHLCKVFVEGNGRGKRWL